MKHFERCKKFISDIPLSIVNIISVLSGLLTIVSFLATVLSAFLSKLEYLKHSCLCLFIFAIIFGVLYWKKLLKYRKLAKDRLETHSREMALVTQEIEDRLFDVLHFYKVGQLTIPLLDSKIKSSLKVLLDSLVCIMELDTGQEINACIKLILPAQTEITISNAQIQTFVRSTKGGPTRSAYDVEKPKPDFIKDNTDFLQIFTKKADVFYEGNLIDYERQMEKLHDRYLNTHVGWKDFYRGTIVVPIRIAHKFLHYTKQDDNYQIVGFLCVDSMSTEAFLPRQKKENTAYLQAYASLCYILLNKYQYYLKKLIPQTAGGNVANA